MALHFPYTYYSCPCATSTSQNPGVSNPQSPATDGEEGRVFDPRSPRANYSLFPLEHLLYCTECHQIRCARCITEEVVCWYCPSCLFEVPSSTVRSEGNRCNRSCFNCPLCTAPLTISSFTPPSTLPNDEGPTAPYILTCPYCNWTSLESSITFESGKNISGQLAKLRNGGLKIEEHANPAGGRAQPQSHDPAPDSGIEQTSKDGSMFGTQQEETFSRMLQFYKGQITDSDAGMGYGPGVSEFSFSSPTAVARLLSMYSAPGKRGKKTKPVPMREAIDTGEGFQLFDPDTENRIITRMANEGWEATASSEQRLFQDKMTDAHFTDELRPMATLLRTKRSKRCKACRTLLSRPEPKVSSTRYKIKVLALNNIPKVTTRPLDAPATPGPGPAPLTRTPHPPALAPLLTHQFVLTLTNPLFDPVHVTLATPAVIPGRVRTRVTILCPQFAVGANSDMWDEALGSAPADAKARDAKARGQGTAGSAEDGKAAEAGKVWDRGRNWTSVVVEVVPGLLPGSTGSVAAPAEDDALEEDEDVLEIPVFVRVEYEAEAGGDEHKAQVATAGGKEKREVAFWCVLGVGRIAS